MSITAITRRVEARVRQLGTTVAQISRAATGHPDTIRNWQRARARDPDYTPKLSSLTQVAAALGVELTWLLGERRPPGFSEGDAEPWTPQNGPAAAAGTLTTWRLHRHMPGFMLLAGDILRVDPDARPEPGDLVLVRVPDEDGSGMQTVLRRTLPGWFVSDDWQALADSRVASPCGVVRDVCRRLGPEPEPAAPPATAGD